MGIEALMLHLASCLQVTLDYPSEKVAGPCGENAISSVAEPFEVAVVVFELLVYLIGWSIIN
jgi:hypothetical protein